MPPALQNPFVLWLVLTAALAAAAYFFMRRELRVKAVLYGSFLIACLVAIWPPYERGDQPGSDLMRAQLKNRASSALMCSYSSRLSAGSMASTAASDSS